MRGWIWHQWPPLLCAAGLFVPLPQAHAGTFLCKSHFTGSHDRQLLHAAMQEVMPAGVPAAGIPTVCRNPGSARAWMDTWPALQPDGITDWWGLSCRRGNGVRQWTCNSPDHHQLIWVYGEVGGILRRLEVSFDDGAGLARARRVALLALQIIQDPSAAPVACGARSADDSREKWQAERRPYVLAPQDRAVELSVDTNTDGSVEVSRNGEGLSLRITDGTAVAPVCWGEFIVVG